METALSLKDITLFIMVPLLGYMCYALLQISKSMAGLKMWMETWPNGHEKVDDERHKEIKQELVAIRASIK